VRRPYELAEQDVWEPPQSEQLGSDNILDKDILPDRTLTPVARKRPETISLVVSLLR